MAWERRGSVVVGRLIRERRLAKDMSQEALAEALGTTQRQISRWEGYSTELPRETARIHLGRVLGIAAPEWHLAAAEAAALRAAQEQGVVQPASDSALMLRFGAEVVPAEEAAQLLEEFAASARTGRGNLIPQNYDDMRRKPAAKRTPPPDPTSFRLRISGDCLRDSVADGEIVVFDTQLPRELRRLVFAVRDEHEAHIKRLVERDGVLWLESDDGWAEPVDEHWRIVAVAYTAQRRLF